MLMANSYHCHVHRCIGNYQIRKIIGSILYIDKNVLGLCSSAEKILNYPSLFFFLTIVIIDYFS